MIMDFIKLTFIEIKNIFKSKFLLILGILVLLMSIAMPVLSAISGNPTQASGLFSSSRAYYESGYYNSGEEPITVGGVTIEPDNPFYWNIRQFEDEKEHMDISYFEHPEAYDLVMEMGEMEQSYYLKFAAQITTYEDYRYDLAWYGSEALYDKYIYEHNKVDMDTLKEALNWRRGVDDTTFETTYINITEQQKQAKIDEAQAYLDKIYQVVDTNDFAKYIELSIEQQKSYIEDSDKRVDGFEATIADLEGQKAVAEQEYNDMVSQNADSEALAQQTKKIENLQSQINGLQNQINDTQRWTDVTIEVTIPMLEYRLQNNIVPRDGSWQDAAITSKEGAMSQLKSTIIMTEEEFNKEENRYLKDQYGTYSKYKAAIQKQIDEWNTNIHIADQSMATGRPDMTFVPKGARSQTANFLYYSMFVALLGVVIGGWVMASEFQFGTIRLLIIRPKTRFKILMSKFAAGLAICLGVYIAGALLNAILNGFLFGFSDFGNPNYSISGQTAFIGFFLPKFLACMVTILFGYCLAFMFSTVVKNIAVSISVPIVFFIGCYIGISLFNGYSYMPAGMPDWLAYTPLPYVQISSFFTQGSSVKMLINNGVPISLGYGIGLLSGISILCTLLSIWVFKRRDITN